MTERTFVAQLVSTAAGVPNVECQHQFNALDEAGARRVAREWAATEKAVLYTATTLRLREGQTTLWEHSMSDPFAISSRT